MPNALLQTLYPPSAEPSLDPAVFRNPPACYRGAPFWSWNTALEADVLREQLRIYKAMGMGGAHIHARTGLATPYLGDEFLALVRDSVETAARLGLRIWLYDEDRWPSGYGGGHVTRDPDFRARHLLWTPSPYSGTRDQSTPDSSARGARTENGRLLARFAIWLAAGRLSAYARLMDDTPPPSDAAVWCAYLETARESPWFNNQTYVDTLNPAAIRRFVEVTHERYAATVGGHFGTVIPAIFTDEPQFAHKQCLTRADQAQDVILPWTEDLADTYQAVHADTLIDRLPELFWELADGAPSLTRYRYHDHLAERFASAYADTLGAWCQAHGLALTGHMMEEPTLESQTHALGEAMRSYRSFTLPGIDMLCDAIELTTAKQAQSAARQYGRPGVTSELYGVTNWDFDFAGHKRQGDWQAALGVTTRVHHLTWVSMAGEAKRDYPASIGQHVPWHLEYPLVEDHFARLNTVLTRGHAVCRIGVIHPIESYWLCFGPRDQTSVERGMREQAFKSLTEDLLFGLLDFDFVAESLLPGLCPAVTGPAFPVGQMAYDVILLPGLRTLRATTLDRLEAFVDQGGYLIFVGEVPTLVDAVPSDRPAALARRAKVIGTARAELWRTLAPLAEIRALGHDGRPVDRLLHQIRADGARRFIFICNTERERAWPDTQLSLRGTWQVTELETFTGETRSQPTEFVNGWTRLTVSIPAHGHLLLQLDPTGARPAAPSLQPSVPVHWRQVAELADPVPVTLSEPNALVLDQAEWRLDDGAWQRREELLRVDNAVRSALGWPRRMEAWAQPWVVPDTGPPPHRIGLRFPLQLAVDLPALDLGLEHAAEARVVVDGAAVTTPLRAETYVDRAIGRLALPALAAGPHVLEVELPFGPKTQIEWHYLLGNFGVEVHGRHTRLTAPIRHLAWGDITRQGLPFYGGNIVYHAHLTGTGQETALRVRHFRAPLLTVDLEGRRVGPIAFDPYRLRLGVLPAGQRLALDLTAFGHRRNTFGALHNSNPADVWYGPNHWRSTGDAWTYEYQLAPTGVLAAPQLETSEDR